MARAPRLAERVEETENSATEGSGMNRHELFMAKVNVHPGDSCWNWAGSRSGSGYGQFWNGQRNIPAHWFLLTSYPPEGQEACHHCDNKLCVRPSHIFIGSRSDNMQDMLAKGRDNKQARTRAARTMFLKRRIHRGVNNHKCMLTEEQAKLAKACPRKYGAAQRMARAFGVSATVVVDIRNGNRWAHLPESSKEDIERAEAFLRVKGKWKE